MLARLRSIFNRKPTIPIYKYGRIRSGTRVRRNTQTGVVEFVLWKAGEMGHTDDYWHKLGAGWELTFVKDNNDEITTNPPV